MYTARSIPPQRKPTTVNEIRVSYRAGNIRSSELDALRDFLRGECARRFTINGVPFEPSDFDVYYELLGEGSSQAHMVAIRVTMHHRSPLVPRDRYTAGVQTSERLRSRQSSATELATAISNFLNTESAIGWHGLRTVSVSLVFAEIGWASA